MRHDKFFYKTVVLAKSLHKWGAFKPERMPTGNLFGRKDCPAFVYLQSRTDSEKVLAYFHIFVHRAVVLRVVSRVPPVRIPGIELGVNSRSAVECRP